MYRRVYVCFYLCIDLCIDLLYGISLAPLIFEPFTIYHPPGTIFHRLSSHILPIQHNLPPTPQAFEPTSASVSASYTPAAKHPLHCNPHVVIPAPGTTRTLLARRPHVTTHRSTFARQDLQSCLALRKSHICHAMRFEMRPHAAQSALVPRLQVSLCAPCHSSGTREHSRLDDENHIKGLHQFVSRVMLLTSAESRLASYTLRRSSARPRTSTKSPETHRKNDDAE